MVFGNSFYSLQDAEEILFVTTSGGYDYCHPQKIGEAEVLMKV